MSSTPKNPNNATILVPLPRDLRDALRDQARAEDVTMAQVVRKLIRGYLGAFEGQNAWQINTSLPYWGMTGNYGTFTHLSPSATSENVPEDPDPGPAPAV